MSIEFSGGSQFIRVSCTGTAAVEPTSEMTAMVWVKRLGGFDNYG